MSYIVFARKYRPQNFDDVIGQSHIIDTLKNAITGSRVAHAYLFAGPRGVGKTTTARIFAKSLNCEKGPIITPCLKCSSCQEIASGSSLDILEIDGASNRGIDEIRSLREGAKFSPATGKFKIYIIDEVHMLSTEAFNALLKILEEPPPHVKFIFATTHAYKVPVTILSRCQRFDFRRISNREIFENLKSIIRKEGLNVSDEALSLIAKYSDGSMRDAQVVLDQIVSFTDGAADEKDVVKILGIVNDEMLFRLSGAIYNKNSRDALLTLDTIINDGRDVMQIVLGLIVHFRNISVAKIGKDLEALIDGSGEKIKRYTEESKKFTIEQILYIIYTFSNTIDFIKNSNIARIPLEASLVKLTQNAPVVSINELIKKVELLEAKIFDGAISVKPVIAKDQSSSSIASCSEIFNDKVMSNTSIGLPTEEPLSEEALFPTVEDPVAGLVDSAISTQTLVSPEGVTALAGILKLWPRIVDKLKANKIALGSYLQEGRPTALDHNILTITFAKQFQFHKNVLDSLENRKFVEKAIKDIADIDLKVSLTLVGSSGGKGSEAGGGIVSSGGKDSARDIDLAALIDDDPIVKKAIEVFGGKISVENKNRPQI